MRPISPGMQNRAAVTQTGYALAVEQMGVNTGHLGCAVGAQAQGASRELIDQLEGLQTQGLSRAGQQRLQVLEQRRHDQLIAIAAGRIEQHAPELLDVPRFRGQDIGNLVRQLPGRRPSRHSKGTR